MKSTTSINYAKNLRPIGENFLVRRKPAKKVSSGGIHLPDDALEPPLKATLLKKGTGKRNSEEGWDYGLEVEELDTILMARFGGRELDDDHLLIPPSALLGVFMSLGSSEDGKKERASFFPVGKRVLVEMEAREKRRGSLFIPDNSQGVNRWGRVVRAGEACCPEDPEELIGKRVYINSHQGTHYKANGKDYIIIEAAKITAASND